MIILEAIPWLLSFLMLGAMAALARSAFSSGESAGRPDIILPPRSDQETPAEE
jgi:hypothetical protein